MNIEQKCQAPSGSKPRIFSDFIGEVFQTPTHVVLICRAYSNPTGDVQIVNLTINQVTGSCFRGNDIPKDWVQMPNAKVVLS